MKDCIFCKIVHGEAPYHKIWEDEKHLAFLSSSPNTEGMTVVVTKEHHPSYAFDLEDDVLSELMIATKKVAKILDNFFDDVGRTGLVLEGFEIDHIHTKLYPLHGTDMKNWEPRLSNIGTYFEKYEGYLSSHSGPKADREYLEALATKIRESN